MYQQISQHNGLLENTFYSPAIPMPNKNGQATVQVKLTNNTPAAVTAAAAAWAVTDIITKAAHGLVTGLKGQVTSDNTKPTGISLLTNYFVRVLDADTFSLYDTKAHAEDLSATTGIVDITNVGVGNHTFTPTTLSLVCTRQVSADGENFDDVSAIDGSYAYETAKTLTPSALIALFRNPAPHYPVERIKFVLASGYCSVTVGIDKAII